MNGLGTLIAPHLIMDTPKNILCATDFGPSSKGAVNIALGLAKAVGGAVTLIHVYDAPIYAGPPFMPLNDAGPEVEKAARVALDATVSEAKAQFDGVRGVLRRGRPWEEVIALAVDMKADLVVLGTHGRRGLPRAILGSVAERVVRLSPVPVLTVPSAEADRSQGPP
jgi:nucleotide-binding universal stress UspA family protein